MDYQIIVFIAHIIIVGPLFIYIGDSIRNKKPLQKELIQGIISIGYITIAYHSYRFYNYYNKYG